VQHLRGGKIDKHLDTGVVVVTSGNLDDKGVRDLIAPVN
jgi:hypothetical protein